MASLQKLDKEHYQFSQGSKVFANCQEQTVTIHVQHKGMQHEKRHTLPCPYSGKSSQLYQISNTNPVM